MYNAQATMAPKHEFNNSTTRRDLENPKLSGDREGELLARNRAILKNSPFLMKEMRSFETPPSIDVPSHMAIHVDTTCMYFQHP